MGEGALMLGTTSRQSSGNDFATFGDKVPKCFRILVTDDKAGIRAKPANFPAMVYSSFSSRFAVSSGALWAS